MADSKISALTPLANPNTGTAFFAVAQGGATFSCTIDDITRVISTGYFKNKIALDNGLTYTDGAGRIFGRFHILSGNVLITGDNNNVFKVSNATGFFQKIIGGDFETNSATGNFSFIGG